MATDSSFDIVSEVDLQAMDDVVNVTMKEINNRFDLKSLGATVEFGRGDKTVTVNAPSEFVVKQLKDILSQKMAKRDISNKVLQLKKADKTSNGGIKEVNDVVVGIEKELAKTIVKDIKGLNLKVQASIMDDVVRVTGKSKDDLQEVIKFIRGHEYPVALQFKNYR